MQNVPQNAQPRPAARGSIFGPVLVLALLTVDCRRDRQAADEAAPVPARADPQPAGPPDPATTAETPVAAAAGPAPENPAGQASGGAAGAPTGASPAPNDCGYYVVDVELPERYACRSDSECGWTAHRPGICGPPLCRGDHWAGNRAWVEAAEALHRRVCGERRYQICERVRCLQGTPTRAVCRDGRCEAEFE